MNEIQGVLDGVLEALERQAEAERVRRSEEWLRKLDQSLCAAFRDGEMAGGPAWLTPVNPHPTGSLRHQAWAKGLEAAQERRAQARRATDEN